MDVERVPAVHEGRHPFVLVALATASTVAALPQTLVLPLLPLFPGWFDSPMTHTAWIATAAMLTGAVSAPVLGWLGDRVGARRVVLGTLAVLLVGAVVCALATSLPVMIVGRVLQGFAAGLTGVAMAGAKGWFTPERFPGAVGVISGTMGIGTGLGVPIAGLVVAFWPWQAVFWITAGACVVAIAAVHRWVPDTRGTHARPFDTAGAVMLTVAMLLVLVPLSLAQELSVQALVGLVSVGVVALLGWVVVENRTLHPFVDLAAARGPAAWRAHTAALALGFAFFLSFTATITLSQSPIGLDGTVLDTGLVQLPASILSVVAGPLAGFAVVRAGAHRAVTLGALVAVAAFGLRMLDHTSWFAVAATASLVSGSVSFAFAALAVVVMSTAQPGHVGSANGLNLLMRQVGASAASVGGALILAAAVATTGAVTSASVDTVLGVGAAAAVVAAVLAAGARTRPAHPDPTTAAHPPITAAHRPATAPLTSRTVPAQILEPSLHPRSEAVMTTPLLSVRDLTVVFDTRRGPMTAVRGVSFDLHAGRTLAIVGESGSGKSTTAACINGLLAPNGRIAGGQILFEGQDVVGLDEAAMNRLRGSGIGLVPQDPMSNLNPLQRVGTQIAEVLVVHGLATGAAAKQRAVELLTMVGLPEPERRARQYPHELSGGMRQRVLVAIGLACRPRLLIADEPTSALDVTVQRTILDEMGRLTGELGTAMLLITHDLGLAAERADDVLVMNKGEAVEQGAVAQILASPRHEYTRRLLGAAPTTSSVVLVEPALQSEEVGLSGRLQPALLRIDEVSKVFPIRGSAQGFTAVDTVSLRVPAGRTVAIVGESGSGKSTTARMVLGLEQPTSGRILVDGRDLRSLRGGPLRETRKAIQPVFQNPYGSLDPRMTIGASLTEPLRLHRVGDRKGRRLRAVELLDQVALPGSLADRLPRELSGGQRQRVAIARALALEPRLVVLDEAVSALDVLVQAQILELLVSLQRDLGLTYLFISHDLAVVRMVSHHVYVMHRGAVVESGPTARIFADPRHEYTAALLDAIPGRGAAVPR